MGVQLNIIISLELIFHKNKSKMFFHLPNVLFKINYTIFILTSLLNTIFLCFVL